MKAPIVLIFLVALVMLGSALPPAVFMGLVFWGVLGGAVLVRVVRAVTVGR